MRTTIPNTTINAPCHLVGVIGRRGNPYPLPCIDAFDVQQHDDAEKDQPETEAHRHAPNRLKQKLVRQGGCGEQTGPSPSF
jgi:hypothetical protein